MPSSDRLNVLLPRGIGVAGKFKNTSIVYSTPFVRVKKGSGSLSDGHLLLQMTFQEMVLICSAVNEVKCSLPDNFQDLTSQYDFLLEQVETLQREKEKTTILNFSKRKELQRKAHNLYEAGFDLFTTIKRTSDRVQREKVLCTISAAQVEEVKAENVSANEPVMGVSIDTQGQPASTVARRLRLVTADETANLASDGQVRTPAVNTPPDAVANSSTQNVPSLTSSTTTGSAAPNNAGNNAPSTLVTLALGTLSVQTTPSFSSSSSPGSPVLNIFNGGAHSHYNTNMQNTNSQGATQITGGSGDNAGAVVNAPPPNPQP